MLTKIKILRFFNFSHQFSTLKPSPIQSQLKITSKTKLNHDSYIYRLIFTQKNIDLTIGQHISIVKILKTFDNPEGQEVIRKYTPISPCNQKEYIDLLVKIYRQNECIQYPNGGKLTPYLESLNVGDVMDVQGPYGKFSYEGNGLINAGGKKAEYKRIFFIAGGTGITPCFQVMNEIAKMQGQNIQMALLYCNKTLEDILLKQQLHKLTSRVNIHYSLDSPPQEWSGLIGYPSQEAMKSIVTLDDPNTLYIHSGPKNMNKSIRNLFSSKYPDSNLFKF